MEIHDLRYLHDESYSDDTPKESGDAGPAWLSHKNIAIFGSIVFMLASTFILIGNINKPTTSESSASAGNADGKPGDTNKQQTITKDTSVKGKVTCIEGTTPQPLTQCELALKTDTGSTYELKNVDYEDIASGVLKPGNTVTLQGTALSSGGSGGGAGSQTSGNGGSGTFYVTSVVSGGSLNPTPSLGPTPTPLRYSVPEAGVPYLTIKYIVDNKFQLSGIFVYVGAVVVSNPVIDDICAD